MHQIEYLWVYFQTFLETWGWTILASVVAIYYIRQKYKAFARKMHQARILDEANDPTRVAILQRETTLVREAQQAKLRQSQGAATSNKSKKK